mmetsp:Transcript_18946/g.52208  ORF Transcript_18946/g.52208 Transcript_18946/m.52208 type:complete len:221 (+) Transcript_18946:85-747(+)
MELASQRLQINALACQLPLFALCATHCHTDPSMHILPDKGVLFCTYQSPEPSLSWPHCKASLPPSLWLLASSSSSSPSSASTQRMSCRASARDSRIGSSWSPRRTASLPSSSSTRRWPAEAAPAVAAAGGAPAPGRSSRVPCANQQAAPWWQEPLAKCQQRRAGLKLPSRHLSGACSTSSLPSSAVLPALGPSSAPRASRTGRSRPVVSFRCSMRWRSTV